MPCLKASVTCFPYLYLSVLARLRTRRSFLLSPRFFAYTHSYSTVHFFFLHLFQWYADSGVCTVQGQRGRRVFAVVVGRRHSLRKSHLQVELIFIDIDVSVQRAYIKTDRYVRCGSVCISFLSQAKCSSAILLCKYILQIEIFRLWRSFTRHAGHPGGVAIHSCGAL